VTRRDEALQLTAVRLPGPQPAAAERDERQARAQD